MTTKKANTHIHMQSHKNLNILQNYSIEQIIGNGKTRIACSADTGSNSQKIREMRLSYKVQRVKRILLKT